MKYLNIDGLKRFTSNLLGKISVAFDTLADKVGELEVRVPEPTSAEKGKYLRGDGTWAVPPDTKTTVDSTLSTASTNPVRNSVITNELNKKINICYGTCTTAAATAIKVVNCPEFKLIKGALIYVDFLVSNSVGSGLQLNVNNTGAKNVFIDCNWNDFELASTLSEAGALFVYTGDYYQIVTTGGCVTTAETNKAGLMSGADKKIVDCFSFLDSSGEIIFIRPKVLSAQVRNNGKIMEASATDYIYFYPWNSFCIDFGNDDYNFGPQNVQFGHDVNVTGKVTSTGSDYAKYYEWLDGNADNEDRRGLFVTLEGEKIRIANSNDDFVLGVVSAAPGFIENAYESQWQGKYLKDIYGERLTQEVEIPESTDEEGNTIPAHIETEYVINPEYNEDEKYIPRSERPEWTYVGLTGELVVNDDGTCEVNGYCKPSVGGIATKSDKGYRVLARLDESHIKILLK